MDKFTGCASCTLKTLRPKHLKALEDMVAEEMKINPEIRQAISVLKVYEDILGLTPETNYGKSAKENVIIPKTESAETGVRFQDVNVVSAYEVLGREMLRDNLRRGLISEGKSEAEADAIVREKIPDAEWNKVGISKGSSKASLEEIINDIFVKKAGFSGTPEQISQAFLRNMGIETEGYGKSRDLVRGKEAFKDVFTSKEVSESGVKDSLEKAMASLDEAGKKAHHTFVFASDKLPNSLSTAQVLNI